LHRLTHICHKASGFTFVLEAHGDVIDVAHDDDLTLGNTARCCTRKDPQFSPIRGDGAVPLQREHFSLEKK
jgi:hypothetical protein